MGNDPPRRYVLDTNALISAYLFPGSNPGQVLDLILGRHVLLMSLELATELTAVLRRDKFDRYLSRKRRDELLAGTLRESAFVETTARITACRDPDDNRILELAVDGQASAIVTGDSDLLALHPFQGIAILNPQEFLLMVQP